MDAIDPYDLIDPQRYGEKGGPLHDPATIAWLIDPTIYGGKDCFVEVEISSELTMGMTVVDYWGARRQEPNCHWVTEVDDDRFFALLYERLQNL